MEHIFLLALLVGAGLSVGMALLGGTHGVHGLHHGGHVHVAHAHSPHGPAQSGHHALVWALSWLGPLVIGGFLLLFGAAGLLVGPPFTLFAAILAGLVGAVLLRLLMDAMERASSPGLQERPEGAVATVNAAIRAGGTGEVIFTLEGLARSMPARTTDGRALPRGAEVVITRVQAGYAYVEPLDQLQSLSEIHS